MLAPRSIVGPLTLPPSSPIVTNREITTPEWISTRPPATIWPWTMETPGWTTTGSPIEICASSIDSRWATREAPALRAPGACT
jgi:hypothetical protein